MSATLVIKEIRRFLESEKAEVLCIKGRWGVGKTYAWLQILGETQTGGKLHAKKYSYVSLFGLNSLDEVRHAIFEGRVSPDKAISGPDSESLADLFEAGKSLVRKSRGWLGAALGPVGFGEIGNMLARSAFFLVRDQLICIDDLERAGAGLSPRDLLGLISFLKEQRNCQIVLLLNDGAMGDLDLDQFQRLLEKVVDTAVIFAPSPAEAAAIAIPGDGAISDELRRGVITLGITNIRVIKKIERIALQLVDLLPGAPERIISQGIVACLLGGWSVYEPGQAPSLEFLLGYNSLHAAMMERENGPDEAFIRWRDQLSNLPYNASDDFDVAIFDAAAAGYFDAERLRTEAAKLHEELQRNSRINPLSKAWERYRESLVEDDAFVIDAIEKAAHESLAITDSININGTIAFLREQGRGQQADAIAKAYVDAQPENPDFFNILNHHFPADQPADPALAAALAQRLATFRDERDPKAVILDIAHGRAWQDDDLALLAGIDVDAYQAMFEGTEGSDLSLLVRTALQMARGHEHDRPEIRATVEQALGRIAAKSPLRARRLRQWGFAPPAEN
ncbi:hypothetical protein GCM10009115_15600 [Sphingopyxis soli]|uniref:KAP NTPase domain-containing protein n=1 Tax=Sphingopyxis soli TaxID=592051 RepID=A0ABP3XGP7_9SPHN|nr:MULTISPECIES: hypothetical protein [Sphingopyxis]MBJ7498222.1 hypothetical protein [Sphingopyxis sp.]HMO73921.1 hypothetical protein [Sphingopyxis sp.]HMP43476.1 hypothetical protein [Sphingopyxis sp.]